MNMKLRPSKRQNGPGAVGILLACLAGYASNAFSQAVSPDIRSPSCGLAAEESSPYLAANGLQGVSPGYAAWFKATLDSRGYAATNLDNSWPWTRLGYTCDYESCPNSPVGLSEYVVPSCSDTNYWGAGLAIPIYVDSTFPAASYGL